MFEMMYCFNLQQPMHAVRQCYYYHALQVHELSLTLAVLYLHSAVVNISFVQLAYIISEGGLLVGQQYPQINSTLSVDTPFMIRISEGTPIHRTIPSCACMEWLKH